MAGSELQQGELHSGGKERREIPSSIKAITFVIPARNEAGNIPHLLDSLNGLVVPDGLQFSVVISDNSSTDETISLSKKRLVHGQPVKVVTTSEKGFVGSARKHGIDQAISQTPEDITPQEHILVNFDADTYPVDPNYLQTLQDVFSNPETMVAYGPIELEDESGRVDTRYSWIQRLFTRTLIQELFLRNGRNARHYINPPFEIFQGANTAVRASALSESQWGSFNFRDDDKTGDDVRFSLELQRRLSEDQVVMDPRLVVRTSARGLEGRKGRISTLREGLKIVGLFSKGDYLPAVVEDDLSSLSDEEREDVRRKYNFLRVVESFISDVDRQLYQLCENESVVRMVGERGLRRLSPGEKVVPAKSGVTGEIIANTYVVIAQNNE
ncbi:MAG TPA: glycosyltransferase [Patescibacteria group bacterium]|nr:glycosyltransferase [Patescibacteria group bacterium]